MGSDQVPKPGLKILVLFRRALQNFLFLSPEEPAGPKTIQEVQRSEGPEPAVYRTVPWHRSTGNLYDEEPGCGRLSPLYRSTDCLHDDEHHAPRNKPWHLSTGETPIRAGSRHDIAKRTL